MKRFALCLFVLLLSFSALAHAQEELHWLSPTIGGNEAVMIVDNGSDWRTRLNLRSEPKKGSEIRGRIYTGTRVELYQDDGEWCTVGLNFGGGHVLTGDEEWYVTFGAGIQRSPRVRGRIPQEKLSESRIPFEGEVYTYGKSFIACLGTVDGKSILRRTDEHGDIFWALGDVPQEAVRIDDGPYEIKSLK